MKEIFLATFKEALQIERDVALEDIFRDYEEWDSLGRLSLKSLLQLVICYIRYKKKQLNKIHGLIKI